MSRDASILLPFASSEFIFRLAIGQWQQIEKARNCGPLVVIERLHNGQWAADDIREVIRWGLIGGGMPAAAAAEHLRDFVDPVPFMPNLLLAQKISMAGYIGVGDGEEDAVPKKRRRAGGERVDDLPNGKVRWRELYRLGGAIGIDPGRIDQLSFYQVIWAADGFIEANTISEGGEDKLSDAEKDEMWDWLQSKNDVPASHRLRKNGAAH